MRPAVLAGFVLAALPAVAAAQNGPYLAVVSDAEVLLHAGPSDKFPDTGKLTRGAQLVVEGEESGWLKVQAPPGSVSWVPNSFVDFDPTRPVPQNVVVSDEVTLAPGRVGLPQPLNEIRKAKVPAGTILTVIGQPVTFDNKKWYPVEPPPGDGRYLPKSAVQAGESVSTAFVVRDAAPAGLAPAGGSATPGLPAGARQDTPPAKPVVNNPLWAQAEAAERDGRPEDAEKLYFQLARLMNEPGGDHDIANLCYTRIHNLREKKRAAAAGMAAPGQTAGARLTGTRANPVRQDTGTAARPGPARDGRPTLLPPVRNDSSNTTGGLPPAVVGEGRPGWTGAGRLLRSPLGIEGQQTYVLESAPGVPTIYAVNGPGLDLKDYVNRRVDLYGATYKHPNVSKPVVVVTQVQPNP